MKTRRGIAVILSLIIVLGMSTLLFVSCDTDWNLNITASVGSFSDNSAFGVASGASSGFDEAYDSVKAPPPPQGIFSYYSYPNNPSTPVNLQKLGKSIVAPSASAISFAYVIQTVGTSGQITINWTPTTSLPSDYTITLLDGTTVLANMGQVNQYSFTATADATYTFTITVTPATYPTATPTPTVAPTSVSNPTAVPTEKPTVVATPNPTKTQPTPTQATINNANPTPTPSIPEVSYLVIVPLLLSILCFAVALRYRKPAGSKMAQC